MRTKEFWQHAGRKEKQSLIRRKGLEKRAQHSGKMDKQGKNMILAKRDNGSKRETPQCLRNERIEARSLERKERRRK
jgi:hypothetical protein